MRYIITSILIFLFIGCSQKPQEKEIKIATNVWIGYTPLFMAEKQGLLRPLHFRLLHNVSLAEAMEIFSVGKADMVTTTQHEYFILKRDFNIKPVILLDRSDGGDMILSNRSLEQIRQANLIEAYLELDSINNELLQSFAQKYGIPLDRFNLHNLDQRQIQHVKNETNKTILIVTYAPYHKRLLQKGFKIVASTKDIQTLLVIDALCAKQEIITAHRDRIRQLKRIIDAMIALIQKDPQRAYELAKNALGGIDYDEFRNSLHLIRWINKPDDKLLQRIEKLGYDTSEIIR